MWLATVALAMWLATVALAMWLATVAFNVVGNDVVHWLWITVDYCGD
jgi:hypothetical protein